MSWAQLVSLVVILFSLMLGYWAQRLSNLRVAELEFKPRQAASGSHVVSYYCIFDFQISQKYFLTFSVNFLLQIQYIHYLFHLKCLPLPPHQGALNLIILLYSLFLLVYYHPSHW